MSRLDGGASTLQELGKRQGSRKSGAADRSQVAYQERRCPSNTSRARLVGGSCARDQWSTLGSDAGALLIVPSWSRVCGCCREGPQRSCAGTTTTKRHRRIGHHNHSSPGQIWRLRRWRLADSTRAAVLLPRMTMDAIIASQPARCHVFILARGPPGAPHHGALHFVSSVSGAGLVDAAPGR